MGRKLHIFFSLQLVSKMIVVVVVVVVQYFTYSYGEFNSQQAITGFA
jgi:hypothetical protein